MTGKHADIPQLPLAADHQRLIAIVQSTKPESILTFRRLIGTSMAAKLIVDIGAQIFNPFLPVIAAGLGMSVVELGRLVGLRSAVGILTPISGALADRHGYRIVIRSALLVSAAGFLLLGVSTFGVDGRPRHDPVGAGHQRLRAQPAGIH
jgi:MFS family permease